MTPAWLTAFEVFAIVLFGGIGMIGILAIIGFVKEAMAHERFVARMRDWTQQQ